MQPKKHAALIKAWADGATIQVLTEDNQWQDRYSPGWFEGYEYRIKPEPKPDIVRYSRVALLASMQVAQYAWTDATHNTHDNVKATFDGETCRLKSIEIIK